MKLQYKNFVCPVCNEAFELNVQLRRHKSATRHFTHKGKYYTWQCPFCYKIFESRRALQQHRNEFHADDKVKPSFKLGGNCTYCCKTCKYKFALTLHEKHCMLNPNRIPRHGHKFTEEQKQHVREKALEGYRTGKYKGWMNCHSSSKSYPEEFFTKVIENEFNNKEYEYNHSFFQYKLDFAWIKLKKCIEIDGQQHETNLMQAESDKRKDAKLLEYGWQVLRIKWSDIMHDTQLWITVAKNFIDE